MTGFSRARYLRLLLLALMCALATAAHAQGCSMCRDTTAGGAPQARAGIRRAIIVLGVPAAAIFVGILVLAGRGRPQEDDSKN